MEGGTPESEIEAEAPHKVVLPNEDVKIVVFIGENLVREEKERILADNQIPNPSLYLMVVYGPDNYHKVMEDTKPIETYTNSLRGSLEYEVHIRNKSSPVERPAIPIKPDQFNVQLK